MMKMQRICPMFSKKEVDDDENLGKKEILETNLTPILRKSHIFREKIGQKK